jgi:hypothetical protein
MDIRKELRILYNFLCFRINNMKTNNILINKTDGYKFLTIKSNDPNELSNRQKHLLNSNQIINDKYDLQLSYSVHNIG